MYKEEINMTDQQTPVLEKPVQTPPPAAPTGPRKKKRKSKLKWMQQIKH